jgi:CRISPR-associated protein Cas4
MKMSKSRILNYIQCGYRFKLDYIFDLRRFSPEPEEGSPLKKGTELHQIFEDYYNMEEAKNLKVGDLDEIYNLLLAHPLAQKENPELQQEYYEHLEHFASYNVHEIEEKGLKEYIPPARELDLYNKELDFQGIIDRVEKTSNGYDVIDYKTGKPGTLKKYILELALYKILFERSTGEKVNEVGIYFSKNNKLRLMVIEEEDEKKALQTMADVREAIDAEYFPKRPSYLCKFCDYCNICDAPIELY